jgi:hypothetical protein
VSIGRIMANPLDGSWHQCYGPRLTNAEMRLGRGRLSKNIVFVLRICHLMSARAAPSDCLATRFGGCLDAFSATGTANTYSGPLVWPI